MPLWVSVAAGRCVCGTEWQQATVCVFAVIKELIVAHWCGFNRGRKYIRLATSIAPACTWQKIQFALSFSFSSLVVTSLASSFWCQTHEAHSLLLLPQVLIFVILEGVYLACTLAFSNSLIHIQSISHIFFDWEQPNTSKPSSVTVPVGSSTAAAGDKLFGSRASRPLLFFNLDGGIQLGTCTHQKCRAKTDA